MAAWNYNNGNIPLCYSQCRKKYVPSDVKPNKFRELLKVSLSFHFLPPLCYSQCRKKYVPSDVKSNKFRELLKVSLSFHFLPVISGSKYCVACMNNTIMKLVVTDLKLLINFEFFRIFRSFTTTHVSRQPLAHVLFVSG